MVEQPTVQQCVGGVHRLADLARNFHTSRQEEDGAVVVASINVPGKSVSGIILEPLGPCVVVSGHVARGNLLDDADVGGNVAGVDVDCWTFNDEVVFECVLD